MAEENVAKKTTLFRKVCAAEKLFLRFNKQTTRHTNFSRKECYLLIKVIFLEVLGSQGILKLVRKVREACQERQVARSILVWSGKSGKIK